MTSGINPTEFKVLILPKPVVTRIGSIELPDSKIESDKFAGTEGQLVAVAPAAFTYITEAEWGGRKPKIGDMVIYGKYAGVRIKGNDKQEYIIMVDKDVLAIKEE